MSNNHHFPVDISRCPGIPVGIHPGAFGVVRRYHIHEGVDLYGMPGDPVYAIREGIVLRNESFTGSEHGETWWIDTDALLVKDEDGFWLYGELQSSLSPGDAVVAGQLLGTLLRVLPGPKKPHIRGHSHTMLHIERWSKDCDPNKPWFVWKNEEPPRKDLINVPEGLLDPTPFLTVICPKQEFLLV